MFSKQVVGKSTIGWQPIPNNKLYLEKLPTGCFLLHKVDLSKSGNKGDFEESVQPEQPSHVVQIIKEKFTAYNVKLVELKMEQQDIQRKLQDINELVRMGFDLFVPVYVENEVTKKFCEKLNAVLNDDVSQMMSTNSPYKCNNGITTIALPSMDDLIISEVYASVPETRAAIITPENLVPSRSRTFAVGNADSEENQSPPHLENVSIKTCSINLRRLEDELPAKEVEVLWENYYESQNRSMKTRSSNKNPGAFKRKRLCEYKEPQTTRLTRSSKKALQLSEGLAGESKDDTDVENTIPLKIRKAFRGLQGFARSENG